MRILADENMPGPVVVALRGAGHDVAWILEDAPGSSDRDVVARMTTEPRILLTHDKGFGESVMGAAVPRECGVVLIRAATSAPALLAQVVLASLSSRDDWQGSFAVIEEGRVRMRTLPRRGHERRRSKG